MTPSTVLCLTFLNLGHAGTTIPSHVDALIKERITNGIRAQAPELDVSFDREACPHRAGYAFGLDHIVLTGDTAVWKGRAQLGLSEILDGQRFDYQPYLAVSSDSFPRAVVAIPTSPRRRGWSRPAIWALGAGLAGGIGGALLSPNAPSRPANIVVFGAGGATLGALLSF